LTDGRIELRFLLQSIVIAGVVITLPQDLRVLPMLPLWSERLLVVGAGLWFLNLVNFMDGIDLMTASEVAPIALGILLIGWLDDLSTQVTLVALALFGAIVGFAPFNRLGKRLFLGDVGTLPIGLLLGWMLLLVAGAGHLAASILLPLYYLADATITILMRLARGARIWEGHQEHFYQRAIQRGFSHAEVIVSVAGLNLVLALLAAVTVMAASRLADVAALALGGGLVAWALARFARGKRGKT
jgi:UDP-N-acetylmuramyl pentapeptide phosphotransferase/UDP-N-acetylglucosamine-1-phosphate transferase